MSIDLHCIDSIEDYDEAIAVLEDYVRDLVKEFVAAPEGKTYLEQCPEMQQYAGSWIDNLLYFGYAYESVTLPRMKRNDVEIIVTELFPRKVSLMNPDEADTAIPELLAFWRFLDRAYQHPQAKRIVALLKKIKPKFKKMMNDSSKFGIAKSFLTQGNAAGFDMTNPEGLAEFQKQYNANLKQAKTNSSNSPTTKIFMPDSEQGFKLVADSSNEDISIDELPPELKNIVGSLLGGAILESATHSNSDNSPQDFLQELRVKMFKELVEKLPPFSAEKIAILREQKISETQPGTILQDFQVLLELIGKKGIAVTGKHNLFPLKRLREINQCLSRPVDLALKRPMQKSYPPIHGLYLLLRASGLVRIEKYGKTKMLVLDPEMMRSWHEFNPTERYCTLLEAWLVRGNEDILGERGGDIFNTSSKCLQYWPHIPDNGRKFTSYEAQQSLSYEPALYNIALMELFGFIEIKTGKPETGKGMRIRQIKKLPFGEAFMELMFRTFTDRGLSWEFEENPSLPLGELQPILQPYFPEWKKTLKTPKFESRSGTYIFKISLGKIWRRIALSSDNTLADLSRMILHSVKFSADHLDMFRYKDRLGRTVEATHPATDGSPSTPDVKIGDLPLAEGDLMMYIFDFGDWWEFAVTLEKIDEEMECDRPKIISRKGKSPEQYPDWDDEEDWDEDE